MTNNSIPPERVATLVDWIIACWRRDPALGKTPLTVELVDGEGGLVHALGRG